MIWVHTIKPALFLELFSFHTTLAPKEKQLPSFFLVQDTLPTSSLEKASSMKRFIEKALNIRKTEWRLVILLYTGLFTFVLGWTWGASIIEAAFLQELGVEALPWFFIIKGLFSIPIVALYMGFADRIRHDTLLEAILIFGSLAVIFGISLLGFHLVFLAFPLLYFFIIVLDETFATHWYTYANSFMDTRSAKRLVPVLSTAVIVAAIVGGLSLPILTLLFSPQTIILIWLVSLVITLVIVRYGPQMLQLQQQLRGQQESGSPSQGQHTKQDMTSYLANIQEGFQYVLQSSMLRWMAVATLFIMMLMAFLEYQTSAIFLNRLHSTAEIANIIGLIVGVSNLVMLPFQLFFLSRIINRIGIGNANLIFPIGNLAICGGLVIMPGLPTAALAYFNRDRFFTSVGYLTDSLIYNAVPLRFKGRARAFISGFVFHIGAFAGGIILLLVPIIPGTWFLPLLISIFAVLYLSSTIVIRRKYKKTLITMLEEQDFSFLLSQEATSLPISDPSTLQWLHKTLEESTDDKFTIFIAKLMIMIGGNDAVPMLGQIVREATSPQVRSAILGMLNAEDMRSDMIRQLYTDFLTDPVAEVRQAALDGLENVFDEYDPVYLNIVQEMLEDPDLEVRTHALIPLLRSKDASSYEIAKQNLAEMLHDPNPKQRARAIRVLGNTQEHDYIIQITQALTDQSDEVRLEAALTFESLLKKRLPKDITALVLEHMSNQVDDPVERVRISALIVLGKINHECSIKVFLKALTDDSPQVRTTAVDTLAQVGKAWMDKYVRTQKSAQNTNDPLYQKQLDDHMALPTLGKTVLPTLQKELGNPKPQIQRMAAVVLNRINREQFEPLLQSLINDTLLTIYQIIGRMEALKPYAHLSSVAVMLSAMREHTQDLIEEVFYLLSAINKENTVKVIIDALRSEEAHMRANAIEALESLTSPQTVWLIEPLFDPDADQKTLLELSQEMWGLKPVKVYDAIEHMMNHKNSAWLRTMMTFALGEIGISCKQSAAPQSNPNGGSARRKKPDIFGALTDLEEQTKETTNQPTNNHSVLSLEQIQTMIHRSMKDPDKDVRLAAQAANRQIQGRIITDRLDEQEEETMLSTIERIIFLKGVPFFQGMTVDQLKVLATVCEEQFFPSDTRIFSPGEPGGTLYMVISGKVGIEQEKRTGHFARLATMEAHAYFGEESLFDNIERSTAATAIQDTMILRLQREPLIALARQHPTLSLELISVLSQRLREANSRIADLTRSRPRELHKLFDQFE